MLQSFVNYLSKLCFEIFLQNRYYIQIREYILFHDVEHCGISSAPGTGHIEIRELGHHSI